MMLDILHLFNNIAHDAVSVLSRISWTLLSSTVAAVAALAGIFFAAIAQTSNTKQQAAGFYIAFTDRYNAPEMQNASYILREFYRTYGNDFEQKFCEEFFQRTELGIKVDRARRVMNRYFSNVAELRRERLISRKLAALLCNFQGINTFYQIVVPLNTAKYGLLEENVKIFNELKKVKPKFGNGFVDFSPQGLAEA